LDRAGRGTGIIPHAKVGSVPQRFAQNDFGALFDEYGSSILALLRRLSGNRHDADDLFQEAAVRVWQRLSDRPALRNRRAWIMTIAYHVFLDHRTRARVTQGDANWIEGQEQSPAVRAEVAEDVCRVNSAVAELPIAVREVVLLHYNGGLTLRETARAMGINPGTAKSRLNTALKELRRRLE
jgi:RNA polymerase sigma-70 factor (ECF subfamily)